MPFKKGDIRQKLWGKLGARKPAIIEKEQQDKMNEILSTDLDLLRKIQLSDNIDETTAKKLLISQARILKIADKLHATKTKEEGGIKNLQVFISPEIAAKNGIDQTPKTDS